MMDWRDVAKTVSRMAPALGAALGSPAGGAVGTLIAAAYGTKSRPEEVSAAIAADPQASVTLHELQLRHAETLAAIITEDVQHAREVHQRSRIPAALTFMLAIMVSGLAGALVVIDTPPDNKDVVMFIAGQVTGAFMTCVAYWVGSSRGSVLKSDALERK